MHVVSKAFWLPKAGNTVQEYEDACWPRRRYEAKTDVARFAVADGATETSFSDLWAQALSEAYYKGWFADEELARPIEKLRAIWSRLVQSKPLEWYAQEKASLGAFSSLLGITFHDPEGADRHGRWRALAVGDSCLFHLRSGNLLAAFPLARADEFNNRPVLLCSVPQFGDPALKHPKVLAGQWQSGDVFYLMTDALACWLLRRHEAGNGEPGDLMSIRAQNQFAKLIREERKKVANGVRQLHNDDVTLLRVTVVAGGP